MATRHRGRDWTDLSALIVRPLRQARCQTSRTSNQSLRRGASRVLCPTPRHLAPACSFPRQRQKGTPTAHRAYRDRNHRKRGPSMRISSLVLALLLVTGAPGALAAQPELKTEEQKTLYALGLLVAQNLSSFALSPADLEIGRAQRERRQVLRDEEPERVERLLLFGLQLGLGRQGAGGAGDEQQGENERRHSHRGSSLPVVSITIRPMRRRRPLLPLPPK